jgi:hypothetical protein
MTHVTDQTNFQPYVTTSDFETWRPTQASPLTMANPRSRGCHCFSQDLLTLFLVASARTVDIRNPSSSMTSPVHRSPTRLIFQAAPCAYPEPKAQAKAYARPQFAPWPQNGPLTQQIPSTHHLVHTKPSTTSALQLSVPIVINGLLHFRLSRKFVPQSLFLISYSVTLIPFSLGVSRLPQIMRSCGLHFPQFSSFGRNPPSSQPIGCEEVIFISSLLIGRRLGEPQPFKQRT